MKKKRTGKKTKKKEFNVNGYVFGALRKVWRWHPARRMVLELAKVHDSKAKDQLYLCQKCDHFCVRKQVHIDHVDPVIDPLSGFTSWDSYIERLFVPVDKLQVLCKDCHQQKTQAENKIRRTK